MPILQKRYSALTAYKINFVRLLRIEITTDKSGDLIRGEKARQRSNASFKIASSRAFKATATETKLPPNLRQLMGFGSAARTTTATWT